MPSNKTSKERRTERPRTFGYAKSFISDWDRLNKAGRVDMQRLKAVMTLIILNDGPLGSEWKDHALKGKWDGCWECHVGGDFLLIYEIRRDGGIFFVRTGTHAGLFE